MSSLRSTSFFGLISGSIALLVCLVAVCGQATAQGRDYFTEEEIEIVRNNQDIDLRIDVLMKMIDRRFDAIGIDVGGWKAKEKDLVKWGELRRTSRLEALSEIRQILNKAMDDIDSIVERDGDALGQNRTTGKLFPKAVKTLDAAARRYLPSLKTAAGGTRDERELGLIQTSIELCEQIIEAASRMSAATPK